ncbi:MAG: class I SAM-dependent methyltransferase [Proteobacteria bacterium]|nr:class I SAM-dependent methyltransferase [Pseudomonadota bacterium]
MEGVERFGDPWEHIRLLSDAGRNEALLKMLATRAPGARVLEVGCGTGLWSCTAAALGAKEVWAVEPTAISEVARELIAANGLTDRVHLLESTVEELEPRPVDLAFSELLNADPFYEGVVEAMESAATWLVPGGQLAPSRLKVYAQLVRSSDSAKEVRDARRAIAGVGERFGLEVGPLLSGLADPGPYRYVTGGERLASEPVLLWDIALGTGEEPDEEVVREITSIDPGPIGGVVIWFEADLGGGITMRNPPGSTTHWGQHVNAWPAEIGAGAGASVKVRAIIEDDSVSISPA